MNPLQTSLFEEYLKRAVGNNALYFIMGGACIGSLFAVQNLYATGHYIWGSLFALNVIGLFIKGVYSKDDKKNK